MTPLQGYVSINVQKTNPPPPPQDGNYGDTVITVADTTVMTMEGLALAAAGTDVGVAIAVLAVAETPFMIMNIGNKVSNGETLYTATIESLTGSVTGVVLGAAWKSGLGIVLTPVLSVAASFLAGKIFGGSDIDNAINTLNNTSFSPNAGGTVDINTSITTSMGMTGTSNEVSFLSVLQQSGVSLGNITVQTDFTDPADIAYIADSLKSFSTGITEVDSPIGKYIIGSNGSESLTGTEPLISVKNMSGIMIPGERFMQSLACAA